MVALRARFRSGSARHLRSSSIRSSGSESRWRRSRSRRVVGGSTRLSRTSTRSPGPREGRSARSVGGGRSRQHARRRDSVASRSRPPSNSRRLVGGRGGRDPSSHEASARPARPPGRKPRRRSLGGPSSTGGALPAGRRRTPTGHCRWAHHLLVSSSPELRRRCARLAP